MWCANPTNAIIPGVETLLVVCLLQSATALGGEYAQKADEYLQQELEAGRFMGSVMVARSNRIVFMKGYGLANREHNISNAPDTKSRQSSLTKQFTAMCILHLQEQGKLSIDDSVTRFMPDSPTNWSGVKIHWSQSNSNHRPLILGVKHHHEAAQ
jgi:CubicO group peptidase (beta-lactamase class C family)